MTAPQPSPAPGAPADGGTGGQAPTGTQPQTTPPAPAAPANGSGTPAKPAKTDLSTLPADVQQIIADARADAAKHRTEGQTAKQAAEAEKQRVAAVLKALGLNTDGTDAPPDPAALAAQIEEANAVAWANAVELNVFRVASQAGTDADRLLDSRAFIDSLDPFANDDPATPEFRKKLGDHVKAYVEKHPTFKATPTGPARSGGDHTGGAGAGRQRAKSVSAAIKAHYGGSG